VLAVLGVEHLWRSRGFYPRLEDSPGLWSLERRKAKGAGPEQVVFIGGSRPQWDIDLEAFDRSFHGKRPIQLAIGGSASTPVLFHLAGEESFKGMVISSVGITTYIGGPPKSMEQPEDYIRFYDDLGPSDVTETRLILLLQRSCSFVLPEVSLRNLIRGTLRNKWPPPSYWEMLADRSVHAHISTYPNLESLRIRREKNLRDEKTIEITREQLIKNLDEIERAVKGIQDRGGRVIFVQFPLSEVARKLVEERYPRKEYWEVMAARTSAIMIHFKDYPSLSGFECPDFLHLDRKDAEKFTEALAGIIFEKLADEKRAGFVK
jgi:hypothetical protein